MATIEQRVLWTLLPNGIDRETDDLKFSLVVSPRLTVENTNPRDLSRFPDWLDWPATIAAAQFEVSVNGGPPQLLTPAPSVDLRSDIWRAIFPSSTPVRSYAFDDMRGRTVMSYPLNMLENSIRKIYGEVGGAADPGELPSRDDLRLAIFGAGSLVDPSTGAEEFPQRERIDPEDILDRLRRESRAIDKVLRDRGRPRYSTLLSAAGNSSVYNPDVALDLLATYHRPLQKSKKDSYAQLAPNIDRPNAEWESFDRTPMPAAQDFQDQIDFHQIVSSLMQHYSLCRHCGLVIDLRLDSGAIPNGAHKLAVNVDWPTQGGGVVTRPDITPVVNVRRSVFAFLMRRELAASPIFMRYLNLQEGPFDFVQMDVDGGAMKVKNFADTLSLGNPPRHATDDSFDISKVEDDNATGLPALRGGGLTLAQRRRDLALQALIYRAGGLQDDVDNGGSPDELFAEDTIRGYRVDIQEDGQQEWRSLFRRNTDIEFVNTGGTFAAEDEEGMARLAAAESPDPTSNPDIVKMSESLFTWTGWSLAAPEPGKKIDNEDSVEEDDEVTPPGLPIRPKYKPVKNSLPMLRFGRRYRVRVRLVDIAGASEPFVADSLTPSEAISNRIMYKRHEPIEAPALALVRDGVVEEPGFGGDMGNIVIRSYNETPDLNTTPTTETSRRHLFAPRTYHRFAEQHGVLDTGPNNTPNPALYQMLAQQDVALEEINLQTPGPGNTAYAVADADAAIPYLPDPLAIGVAVRVFGADGFDPTQTIKGFYYGNFDTHFGDISSEWPTARPAKIVVREGPNNAVWNPGDREFQIALEKAEKIRVRICSIVPRNAWRIMEIVDMIRSENPGLSMQALAARINDARHWMFTPWKTITIVHAVQRPLVTPEFPQPIGVLRQLGDTGAVPFIRGVPLDAKSTGRIDLHSDWKEPLDNPEGPEASQQSGPVVRDHTAIAFDKKLARDDTPNRTYNLNVGPKKDEHVFPDTRYRRVEYTLKATTRYKEFLEPSVRNDKERINAVSPPRVTWIPNSAPPPQPGIVYAVPTFGWNRSESGDRKSSLRSGGGIRVYLDRPWFETGFTEMLGVMLPPESSSNTIASGTPSAAALDAGYKSSVTMWGADPIWASDDIKSVAPSRSSFPLARWSAPIDFPGTGFPAEEGTSLPGGDFKGGRNQNLPHPGGDGRQLRVAPHAVGYDAERGLYYSDIVVTAPRGAYYPFIRLALARYNPVSVDEAHLSPIVLTQFQQLTPDRLTVVTRKGNNRVEISVYGDIIDTQKFGQPRLPVAGIFGVELQVLDAGADPDLGWRKVDEPGDRPDDFTLGAAVPSQAARAGALTVTRRGALQAQPQARAQSPTAETARAAREIEGLIAAGRVAEAVARPDFTIAWQRPLLWRKEVNLPLVSQGAKRRLMVVEAEAYQSGERGSTSAAAGPRAAISRFPPISGRFVYFETIDV